jgi:protein-L-isoaspartate O-methyltransferase
MQWWTLSHHMQLQMYPVTVAAGTGYMAACLAQLAGPQGQVLALEKQPKLAERARAAIQASLPTLHSTVNVRVSNVMAGAM